MKPDLTITITGDGSSTVFNSQLNQHYHSIHGAINESELVFIRNGLDEVLKTENAINILEIGMGTGLNVLLSVLKSKLLKVKMNFVAVEAYPLQEGILDQINYPEIIGSSEASGYFSKIHKAGWAYPSFLSDYFILSKIQSMLEDVTFSENQFNIIYFDAFDPHAQPEMWATNVFEKMYACLKPGGFLVTYCTNSEVRRTMKACGFELEKLKGPTGKREVLRARKRL
jgi:tRNA U34 5-methylaminomethyl-2-thiouridine-forming methyltransferase MnmC